MIQMYQSKPPMPALLHLVVFFIMNSLLIFGVDYVFEKVELSRKNYYYLPILFALNFYVFFKANTFHFIFFQIFFLSAIFFIIRSQNKENVRMEIFHLSFILSLFFFILPQSAFMILPMILLLLFFSVLQIYNIGTLMLSILLSFFFLYSNFYFADKIWKVDLRSNFFEFFKDGLIQLKINQVATVLTIIFVVGLYEVPKALRKTSLFRKNFLYFSLVVILVDLILAVWIRDYTPSFALILISYLFGNFIQFRAKYYMREIFFTGALISLIVLLLM